VTSPTRAGKIRPTSSSLDPLQSTADLVPTHSPSIRGDASISGRQQVVVEHRPASPEVEETPTPQAPKRSSFKVVPAAAPRRPAKTQEPGGQERPSSSAASTAPRPASLQDTAKKSSVRFEMDGDQASASASLSGSEQCEDGAAEGKPSDTSSGSAAPLGSVSAGPFRSARRGGSRFGFSAAPRSAASSASQADYQDTAVSCELTKLALGLVSRSHFWPAP
jgi:type IV secretory pathway VirB10-like protein